MGFPSFTLDDYIVTPEGDVINKKWNRKVKPQPNGKGYLRFSVGGKMMFVHRIVAQLYVPNPDNKPQVNHKDGNKLNNHADNLEWVTNQENRDHAIKNNLHIHGESCSWSKLTLSDVNYIRNHANIKPSILSKKFGVSPHHIREIIQYKVWK